jgi:hypothetical protein
MHASVIRGLAYPHVHCRSCRACPVNCAHFPHAPITFNQSFPPLCTIPDILSVFHFQAFSIYGAILKTAIPTHKDSLLQPSLYIVASKAVTIQRPRNKQIYRGVSRQQLAKHILATTDTNPTVVQQRKDVFCGPRRGRFYATAR